MRTFHRPSLSLVGHVLATLLAAISLSLAFVPKQSLVEAGTFISPVHSLQDKTLLLIDLLKIAVPIFSGACLAWVFCPRLIRLKIQDRLRSAPLDSRALLVLMATAFVIRLAWVIAFPTRPYADSEWYFRNASELAAGEGYVYDLASHKPLAAWPIGYPLALSLLFRITGPSEGAAKLANVVLSVLCIALTYLLARRIFDSRVAVVAALILTVLPGMIVYSSLISTDLFFMTMVTACFAATLCIPETVSPIKSSLVVGMINGALSLIRATGLTLIPVWIMIQWLRFRGRFPIWRCLLAAGIGTLVVVFPWTVRNYIHFGKIILVSTNGGPNFWIGNNPLAYGGFMWPKDETNPLFHLIGNELEIDRQGYALGFEFIRHDPGKALKLLPAKMFYLYNSDDFGLHWNRLSALKPAQFGSGMVAFAFTNMIYVIVSLFAMIGVASLLLRRRGSSLQYSGMLLVAYWTIVHLPYFGQDRFVLPLLPVLVMYAAVGIGAVVGLKSSWLSSEMDASSV